MNVDLIKIIIVVLFGFFCFLFVSIYNKGKNSSLLRSYLFLIIHTAILCTGIMVYTINNILPGYTFMYSLLTKALYASYYSLIWFYFVASFTVAPVKLKYLVLIVSLCSATVNCIFTIISLFGYNWPVSKVIFITTGLIQSGIFTYGIYLLVRNTLTKKKTWITTYAIPFVVFSAIFRTIYQAGWLVQHNILFQVLSAACTLIALVLFIPEMYKHSSFSNLISLSLSSILNSMEAAVIAVDVSNNILLINNSFKKIFFADDRNINTYSFAEILDILEPRAEKDVHNQEIFKALHSIDVTDYTGELSISFDSSEKKRCYNVKIESARSKRGEIYARIVTLTDITWYIESIDQLYRNNHKLLNITRELDGKNTKLEELNKQIVIYTRNIDTLISERERKKISVKIYALLEKTFREVIDSLEYIVVISKSESKQAFSILNKTIDFIRENFRQVNLAIRKQLANPSSFNSLGDAIQDLSQVFSPYDINIEFCLDQELPDLREGCIELIHKSCEIAFNNSIIHGNADEITVLVKNYETIIKLFIFDNGTGCMSVKPGESFSWLNDRVSQIQGNLKYGSDGRKGFSIILELPKNPVFSPAAMKIPVYL